MFDFYINTYLLREEPRPMEDGTMFIDFFLGDFFIRKCMWSTPGNIKTNAASIKKFYKCMLDNKKINKSSYDYLCNDINMRNFLMVDISFCRMFTTNWGLIKYTVLSLSSPRNQTTFKVDCLKTVHNYAKEKPVSSIMTALTSISKSKKLKMTSNTVPAKKTDHSQ